MSSFTCYFKSTFIGLGAESELCICDWVDNSTELLWHTLLYRRQLTSLFDNATNERLKKRSRRGADILGRSVRRGSTAKNTYWRNFAPTTTTNRTFIAKSLSLAHTHRALELLKKRNRVLIIYPLRQHFDHELWGVQSRKKSSTQ